jgi:hypothetical protein
MQIRGVKRIVIDSTIILLKRTLTLAIVRETLMLDLAETGFRDNT